MKSFQTLIWVLFILKDSTNVFFASASDSWLFLQHHTESTTCQSSVKQVQAIKVDACQRDRSLFTLLYPDYNFPKLTNDDESDSGGSESGGSIMISATDISSSSFSFKFILNSSPPTPVPTKTPTLSPNIINIDIGDDEHTEAPTSSGPIIVIFGENDKMESAPSMKRRDPTVNTTDLIIINPTPTNHTDDVDNDDHLFELIVTKPLGQFHIYHDSNDCSGTSYDTLSLHSYVSTIDTPFVNVPTTIQGMTEDWLVNGCQKRNSSGQGALSLGYFEGNRVGLYWLPYSDYIAMEEEVFETISTKDCDYASLISTTITVIDSCVSNDGITSTYYQCSDGHSKQYYPNSNMCSGSNSTTIPLSSTCPLSLSPTTSPTASPIFHIDISLVNSPATVDSSNNLYHTQCLFVERQLGHIPTLSPVLVPTPAPSTLTTPLLDLRITFSLSPLSSDNETITENVSLRELFAAIVCNQLQVPDISACSCPERDCLSIITIVNEDTSVFSNIFRGQSNQPSGQPYTVESGHLNERDSVFYKILNNFIIYFPIFFKTTFEHLSKEANIRGAFAQKASIIRQTSTLTTELMINMTVTVNTIDFFSALSTNNIQSNMGFTYANTDKYIDSLTLSTLNDNNVAIDMTLSALQSRLDLLASSNHWLYSVPYLQWVYSSWFADETLELHNAQLTNIKVYNPDIPTSSPTFSPTIGSTSSSWSTDPSAFTDIQLAGLSISIGAILLLPLILWLLFRARRKWLGEVSVLPTTDDIADESGYHNPSY